MPFKNTFLDIIFPPFCVYCHKMGKPICNKCESFLIKEDFPICIICENPSINGLTHLYCKRQNPNAPDLYRYNYEYNFMAREIIISSKGKSLAYKNTSILFNHQVTNFFRELQPDYIIPIPPSKSSSRLKDIVIYFAENLKEILNIPIMRIIVNKGETQKTLDKENRIQNAKHKFIIKDDFNDLIKDKKILMLDDLSTTGSSLISATSILKTKKAKAVYCYTLCKDLRYNYYNNV